MIQLIEFMAEHGVNVEFGTALFSDLKIITVEISKRGKRKKWHIMRETAENETMLLMLMRQMIRDLETGAENEL